jgi:hypothetical protein
MGKATNTYKGEFDGNNFKFDEDFSEFSLPLIDYSVLKKDQPLIAVVNADEENGLHIFDENGRSVSLPSDELVLDGEFHDGILEFANQSIQLNEEYLSRLLYCTNQPKVVINIERFSKSLLSDSFSLVALVVENRGEYLVLKIDNKSFVMNRRTDLKSGEKIRLYYKIEDLIMYDGENRLTCHYPLNQKIDIKVLDAEHGIIKMLGKRIKLNKPISSGVGYATITESGFELSNRRGRCSVWVSGCLDEEFINGKKMNYLAIKNIDSYISVVSKADFSCFSNKKVWLNIIPDGLMLREKR